MLGLSVTPLSYLEAYGSLHSAASYDDQHSPGLIDVLGNTHLGMKLVAKAPVFGSPCWAIGDTETSRGSRITRVERFGLGINRVDRFQTGLGVEARLPIVRPFVEWNLEVPVNRQSYTCSSSKSAPGDRCLGNVSAFSALPSTLTLGARVSPLLKGLSATAAIDIGTSGTSNFLEELAPTLPWDLWLGVGYAFDIEEPKPVSVVVVQERAVPAPALPPVPPVPPVPPRLRPRTRRTFEHVIPGTVTVNAASHEYLFVAQTLTLAARQELAAELRLRKRRSLRASC